jgi:hypothetical protein
VRKGEIQRREEGIATVVEGRLARYATIREGDLKLKVNQQQLVIKPTIREGGMR